MRNQAVVFPSTAISYYSSGGVSISRAGIVSDADCLSLPNGVHLWVEHLGLDENEVWVISPDNLMDGGNGNFPQRGNWSDFPGENTGLSTEIAHWSPQRLW